MPDNEPSAELDPTSPDRSVVLDGRELRSQRTRGLIIEAWLDLVEGGNVAPTARETADQAGIGLRTIFQHFSDMEDLHANAAAMHFERIAPFLVFGPVGDFDLRTKAFVYHRRRLFERVTPVRRAVMHRFTLAPHIGPLLRVADERFSAIAFQAFGPELDALAEPQARLLRASLASAVSWSAWDYLRTSIGMSSIDAAGVFDNTCRSLFGRGPLAEVATDQGAGAGVGAPADIAD